ncbi:hypothetical protein HJFPF1_04315 [Paramyrothecium foliicola]|nr:hypothetical protein HJFPF1_04315 [Paramyrothecium foliicola]
MEGAQKSLESFFRTRFHVVPTQTNRQDQWYKRSYQSWKELNGNREPLILTPKESREDWVPELQECAVLLVRAIQNEAMSELERQKTLPSPIDTKLFEDSVLEHPFFLTKSDFLGKPSLTPRVQRLSFWISEIRHNFNEQQSQSCAIRALLEADQIRPLLYLANHPLTRTSLRTLLHLKVSQGYQDQSLDVGWASIIEDSLRLMVLLAILKCFPESLSAKDGFNSWVPFAFMSNDVPFNYATTTIRLMDDIRGNTRGHVMESQIENYFDKCFRVLIRTHALFQVCELPQVDWVQRVMNATLYFVGFESWNRARQGQTYLGCQLNVTKGATWLKTWEKPDERASDVQVSLSKNKKQRDPLTMREPKQVHVPEPSEEEKELASTLAELETREAAYGLKRSTKYGRRHKEV